MNNKSKRFTFFWFIENYSYCWHKTGESLVSPVFTADGLEGTKWTLKLYPRAEKDIKKNHICMCLRRNDDDGPDIVAMNYSLSIVAEDGSALTSENRKINFSKKFGKGWYFRNMVKNLPQLVVGYLPKDILVVRCDLWNGDKNVERVAPICARTRIGIESISFLHGVEGFSSLEPNLKPVRIQSHLKMECLISSSLNFTDDICCLEIKPSRSDHILAKCKISFLDTTGKIINCSEADNRFEVERKDIQKMPLSLTKSAIISKKSEYLPGDKLSLLCECVFSTGIEFQKIEGMQNVITPAVEQQIICHPYIKYVNIFIEKWSACPSALDDLKGIYYNNFLTDVVLTTKTSSFPAHKIVLCARSPVFKVMMSKDMKEKITNSIQVDDLEDETVQQLLLFLYSDNLEDLQWDTATKLYYAADKYQIEKLRLSCSSFLMGNLSVSTATELLLLADTHSDSYLQKVVEDFILEHDEQVFCSGEWEKLMDANPQLAMKTMHLKYKTKKN